MFMNFDFSYIFTAILSVLVPFLYWLFSFVIIYHLVRFGVGTKPKRVAAVFLLGVVILFTLNILCFVNLDRDSLVSRFENMGNNSFNILYER